MLPDTNTIDPQLRDGVDTPPLTAQPPLVLPTRTHDGTETGVDGEDGERQEGSEKRQKLNLWKCKQCREARKKCYPTDRVWPAKCDRCLLHRPHPLECSEPELNNRKRGPNQPKDKEKEKQKETEKAKTPQPPTRSMTGIASTSEKETPTTSRASSDDDSDTMTSAAKFERPQRTPLVLPKSLKREHPGSSSVVEIPKPVVNKEDIRPASCYPPLQEGQFRILQLAPGRPEDPISGSFVVAFMDPDREIKYEVISYLWGLPNQKAEKINLVDPQGKSHPIYIRSHLYQALKNLRHPEKVRSFWVDALCINYGSGNQIEKNSMAAMKRYIFHTAQNLCFWLGEDEDSKRALKFIPRIMEFTAVDNLASNESTIDDWAAFGALLGNPVFSRLMLVQEVAVAQNVTLHCGQPAIYYGDLVDAVSMFKCYRNQISLMFRRSGRNHKVLSNRTVTRAERFIEVSVNALRIIRTADGELKAHRRLSLEALVSYLTDLSATDPLDRIYSMLAIAKDGPKLDERTLFMSLPKNDRDAIHPDYDANVVDVYQNFVIRAIKSSDSLDMICRLWASPVSEALPTWIHPLQRYRQPKFDDFISERTEADSLVGLPDYNNYHASRGTTPTYQIKSQSSFANNRSKILCVNGIRVDTIARLGPRASEGIILYEWLQLGGCVRTGANYTVPEAFWRTLVADRGPNGTMPPSWYARVFDYCLLHLTDIGDINTNRIIHEHEKDSSLVVSFLERVQSVIWNRKLLVSEKNRWLGLVPMATLETDIICILYGCSVPVVLRQVKTEEGVPYFQLVGECYVHGIMDGEIIDAANEYAEQEFDLK